MKKLLLLMLCLGIGPPLLRAQLPASPFSGTITASGCMTVPVGNKGTVTFQVTGGAWTGTIQPEGVIDGNTAFNIKVTPVGSTTAQSTVTANGTYSTVVAGLDSFKLCGNTVSGGTATVKGNAVQVVAFDVGIGGGGGGGGGGATTFDLIGSGVNTTAAMVLGPGSSLATAGFGTINGTVFANATETVQQAITQAGINGSAAVPATSVASDVPNGTRLNSRDRPILSSQPAGVQNTDYRYGGRSDSYFNPGHDASGLNIWYGPSEICNWNQPFGNVSNGGTNNALCQVVQSNFLSGGQNVNGNGYTNKTDFSSILGITNNWTPGESEGIRGYSSCYSNGDCTAGFFTALHYGTTNGGSDEGLEGPDLDISQGTAEYTGSVSGNPAAGATSVTITPTLALAIRTQGEGREIFDSTQGTTTGTITSLTGSGLVAVVGSGTGWGTSTATTTSAAITVSGTNNAPGSVNVLVASSAGFSPTNVACISDGTVWEQTTVTAVPDGTHVTATFTLPYASGATIATGGLCGWGLELDEDRWTTAGHFGFVTVTPPLHQIWPIIKSPTATTLTILIQTAGGADSYAGQATLPGAAYHVYPMTQLTSVVNGGGAVSDTLTLSPNTIDFANGDTIYVAVGPTLKHQGVGNWQLNTWFASQPLGNYQSGPVYNGLVSANDFGWQITNNTTLTKYAGHGGNLIVPNTFLLLQGLYNYGLKFNLAPDRTAIYLPCPLNSSGVASCAGNPLVHLVDYVNGHGGSDYIAYDPTSGSEYFRFQFQNGGHACAFGQNANGISCDGHLRTGQNGFSTGVLDVLGSTSGITAVTVAAAAGTFNFILPITAGTVGQFLTSQAGGSTAMTWTDNPGPDPTMWWTTSGDLLPANTANLFVANTGGNLNKAVMYGYWMPFRKTSTRVCWESGTTADNTAATYDVGLYTGAPSGAGTLIANIGPTAGTTFASAINTISCANWTQGTVTIPAGRIYVGLTTSQAGTQATIFGANMGGLTVVGSVASITAGGTLSALTLPADANSSKALPNGSAPWLSIQ